MPEIKLKIDPPVGPPTVIHPRLAAAVGEREIDMIDHLYNGSITDSGDVRFHQGYLKAIADLRDDADQLNKEITESQHGSRQ